jgi:dihydrofolate synthase/folylpolyglutamate synthase
VLSAVSDSYAATLQRLYAYERSGMRLGLDGPRALHEALGHPEQSFGAIQIAGTNGKGTTAACLASMLRAAGVRTGLFTSPHLIDFSERIRVNGEAIARERVEDLMQTVGPVAESHCASYFETVTALAAVHFRDAGVEIVAAEVGLGGRLDATTVWPSRLGGITAIDLDHMETLGGTRTLIAREKAGIAREGGTVVCAEDRAEIASTIEEEVAARGARALLHGRDWSCTLRAAQAHGVRFDVILPGGETLADLTAPLVGAHQARNAALAATLAHLAGDARVDAKAIREGLGAVRWPGRAEIISARTPRDDAVDVLCDVAHNPAAAFALAETLRLVRREVSRGNGATSGARAVVGVVGMLRDKDAAGFAAAIGPAFDHVVATSPESGRALDAADLAQHFARWADVAAVEPNLTAALGAGLARAAARRALLVVTGSCYTVGQALPILGIHHIDRI